MTQAKWTEGPLTFTAGEDLGANRRVKIDTTSTTTPMEVVYADAGEDFIGITMDPAESGDLVTVAPLCREGSFLVEANEAFDAGDDLYGADDGRVADTSDGTAYFKALEDATAQGDIVEVILHPHVSTTAASTSISDSGGYTDETTVEAALQEIYPFIPTVISDPGDGGAIPVTRSGVCALTTGGSGETRTLADPDAAGLQLTVTLDVDGGGDAVVTVATAFNDAGNDTLTFADAGETVTLIATQIGGTPVWRLIENDGAAASTA